MAVIFVLILVGVFRGYVSGYPTTGMLKINNISFFRLYYSVQLTSELLAFLGRDRVL